MTRQVDRYPLIEDIISGYRRLGATRLIDTPLWAEDAPARPSVSPPRPEIPRTGLSSRALSTAERSVLRRVAPTVAVDLDSAERLHGSPMMQTSRSIPAATAAEAVDRLRLRARELMGEQPAAV